MKQPKYYNNYRNINQLKSIFTGFGVVVVVLLKARVRTLEGSQPTESLLWHLAHAHVLKKVVDQLQVRALELGDPLVQRLVMGLAAQPQLDDDTRSVDAGAHQLVPSVRRERALLLVRILRGHITCMRGAVSTREMADRALRFFVTPLMRE